MSDNVNHPSHYADGWSNGAEVIDITENLNFNRGNAVKYIARAGVKDPEKILEDLEKAQWYLNREIGRITAEGYADGFAKIAADLLDGPRVWGSLEDVPIAVKVRDTHGTLWRYGKDSWEFEDDDIPGEFIGFRYANELARRLLPLTEVLEGTE